MYYHWSRNNDQSALTKLLALEEKQDKRVTEDAEMQFFLASYYVKFDDEKTIDLLYKTLELNKAGEAPNPEIYPTLVSLFYKHEKYKHAYTARSTIIRYEDVDILPIEHQLAAAGKARQLR